MLEDTDFYKKRDAIISELLVKLDYTDESPQRGQIILDWLNKNFIEVGTRVQHDKLSWNESREAKDALDFHAHYKHRMYLSCGEEMFREGFGSYCEFKADFPRGSYIRELRLLVLK